MLRLRLMSKKFIAVIFILLYASCVFAFNAPEGFAGIKWRSYFHEFDNMKEYARKGIRFKVFTREGDNIALNNIRPVHVFYNFLDGRFSGVNMVLDISDKDKALDILTRQYGACRKLNEFSYIWEFPECDQIFPFIIKAESLEIRGGSRIFNVQYSTPEESEFVSTL